MLKLMRPTMKVCGEVCLCVYFKGVCVSVCTGVVYLCIRTIYVCIVFVYVLVLLVYTRVWVFYDCVSVICVPVRSAIVS